MREPSKGTKDTVDGPSVALQDPAMMKGSRSPRKMAPASSTAANNVPTSSGIMSDYLVRDEMPVVTFQEDLGGESQELRAQARSSQSSGALARSANERRSPRSGNGDNDKVNNDEVDAVGPSVSGRPKTSRTEKRESKEHGARQSVASQSVALDDGNATHSAPREEKASTPTSSKTDTEKCSDIDVPASSANGIMSVYLVGDELSLSTVNEGRHEESRELQSRTRSPPSKRELDKSTVSRRASGVEKRDDGNGGIIAVQNAATTSKINMTNGGLAKTAGGRRQSSLEKRDDDNSGIVAIQNPGPLVSTTSKINTSNGVLAKSTGDRRPSIKGSPVAVQNTGPLVSSPSKIKAVESKEHAVQKSSAGKSAQVENKVALHIDHRQDASKSEKRTTKPLKVKKVKNNRKSSSTGWNSWRPYYIKEPVEAKVVDQKTLTPSSTTADIRKVDDKYTPASPRNGASSEKAKTSGHEGRDDESQDFQSRSRLSFLTYGVFGKSPLQRRLSFLEDCGDEDGYCVVTGLPGPIVSDLTTTESTLKEDEAKVHDEKKTAPIFKVSRSRGACCDLTNNSLNSSGSSKRSDTGGDPFSMMVHSVLQVIGGLGKKMEELIAVLNDKTGTDPLVPFTCPRLATHSRYKTRGNRRSDGTFVRTASRLKQLSKVQKNHPILLSEGRSRDRRIDLERRLMEDRSASRSTSTRGSDGKKRAPSFSHAILSIIRRQDKAQVFQGKSVDAKQRRKPRR